MLLRAGLFVCMHDRSSAMSEACGGPVEFHDPVYLPISRTLVPKSLLLASCIGAKLLVGTSHSYRCTFEGVVSKKFDAIAFEFTDHQRLQFALH